MNQKQRTAQQRVLMREAEGKLKAIAELFGVEDEADLADHIRAKGMRDYSMSDYAEWDSKVQEFLSWVWDESPIA